jgi:hypothetical protein
LTTARKSTIFLAALAAGISVFALVFLHAASSVHREGASIGERAFLIERLGLTDLCLFSDARYSRNPAVADRATPFQDHPASLEHFPSGSIVRPPAGLRYGMD